MLERRVRRLGHPMGRLELAQLEFHPLEVRGTLADGGAGGPGGHERRVEVRFLEEEAERQPTLAVDLAAVRLVETGRDPEQRRLAGPVRADEPDPLLQRHRSAHVVEDDERADLAAHVRESQERHQPAPVPAPRHGRERGAWRPPVSWPVSGSGRWRGRPHPGSARACLPRRAPSSAGRVAGSRRSRPGGSPWPRLRSAGESRWHHEQKWVDRAPMTIRRTGRPQRGHGSPVRW